MRLFSFRIQNFKSIIDTGEIKISETDPVTIFAGQNEAGKSAILEALTFFEEGADLTAFNETNRRADTFPRVECKYLFSSEELDQLESVSNKEIRDLVKTEGISFVRGSTEADEFQKIELVASVDLNRLIREFNAATPLQPAEPAPIVVEPTPLPEPIPAVASDVETIEPAEGVIIEDPAAEPPVEELVPVVEPVPVVETPPVTEPASFSEDWLSGNRPKFIFYNSFSDILPNKIARAQLGSNNAVKDFEQVFSIDFAALLDDASERNRTRKINTVNESASEDLNKYWSQKLENEPTSYRYQIQVNIHPTPDESTVTFLIDQADNNPLYFGQKSKGFRWFSSFNLRLRAHQVTAGNFDDFVLLIDEPGQGLHEEAQKDAKKVLNEIGAKGFQILFTTHQPQLLKDDNDVTLSRIKLVIKSKDEGTKVKNPAQQTSQEGFRDALSPVRAALGLISLDIASFEKSRKTIVVEGITDYYYVEALLKAHSIEDVKIIPSAGVSHVPAIYSILSGWGIKAAIMVDDDGDGTKFLNQVKKNFFDGASEEDVDKMLYKNASCKGIEDTFDSTDFVTFADPFLPQKEAGKSSSELTKLNASSKEIIGRTFYDKMSAGELVVANFSDETKARIAKIIEFAKK